MGKKQVHHVPLLEDSELRRPAEKMAAWEAQGRGGTGRRQPLFLPQPSEAVPIRVHSHISIPHPQASSALT